MSGNMGLISRLRRRRPTPDDSILTRALTLATVLVAIAAVGVHEEFTAQALVAAVATCAGFWLSYHRRNARNWWLKLIIAATILLVARDFFAALVESPTDPRVPLVRLFLWLQALHSFDLPARKDLKYSLASSVVLMAVAGVYARDMAFGSLLVAYAVVACVTVVAMVPRGREALPARLALKIGAGLGAAVLAGGALAFVAIPHPAGLRVRWMPVSPRLAIAARLYGRIINPAYPDVAGRDPATSPPIFNPQGYVGFSTYVDLRLRGELSDTVVLRVRATRPALWRGLAFDEYTGIGWRMSDRSVDEYTSDEPRIVPRYSADEPWPAGSEQVIQTFYVEAAQPNVIFGAYRPSEVYFPTNGIAVDRYAGLRSPVRLEAGMIYSVISRVPAPPVQLLRKANMDEVGGRRAIPDAIRRRYLQLPPITDRVRRLAEGLTAGRTSLFDRAIAVNRYLVANYGYDLQAPLLPPRADAVDHFLFVFREGSCEAFASAMAVLLRAAGVPARLVTGYATGTYNVLTGYYDVRNSDAHAWVEVYIPRAGWIPFEATPGFATPEEVAGRAAGSWLLGDAVGRIGKWIVTHAFEPVRTALGQAGRYTATGFKAEYSFLAALILTLAAVRRRHAGLEPISGLEVTYDQMIRALARSGIVRQPSATPREFLLRVPPTVAEEAAVITAAFEQRRYSPHVLPDEQAAAARSALMALRSRLRGVRGNHR